jgi:hypothetical protein
VEEGGQKNYLLWFTIGDNVEKLVIKQLKIVEVEEGGPKKKKQDIFDKRFYDFIRFYNAYWK